MNVWEAEVLRCAIDGEVRMELEIVGEEAE